MLASLHYQYTSNKNVMPNGLTSKFSLSSEGKGNKNSNSLKKETQKYSKFNQNNIQSSDEEEKVPDI
jgi:hypothetical protein